MEENKQQDAPKKEMSFWDHLDDLRWTLMRIAIGIVICMGLVFSNKNFVFDDIIFPPKSSDFVVYRMMCKLADYFNFPDLCPEPFNIHLINTTVSGQFFTHLSTSFWLGFVLAFPWIIYQLWLFIRPALYDNERRYATWAFLCSSFLFFVGALVCYFVVFPITIKFLGTYQVSETIDSVPNLITLDSYINTLVILTLSMGLVFEMPILFFILSQIGIVRRSFLRQYRRYAIVIILILAAIITPTVDPFTMIVVSIPILLLYELSIWVCKE